MTSFTSRLARRIASGLACALLLAGAAVPALASPATYHVSIDTQSLAGKQGYLDFLMLGLANVAPVRATLSHLAGDFADPADIAASGDAAGSAKDGVAIGNGSAWNEFAQWARLGSTFTFDLDFDVDTSDPLRTAGSALTVALLDRDYRYLDATSDLLTFYLQPGQADTRSFDAAYVGFGDATAAVPEAPSAWLLAAGLLGGALARRRNRGQ